MSTGALPSQSAHTSQSRLHDDSRREVSEPSAPSSSMPSLHGASASQLDTQSQGSPHQLGEHPASTQSSRVQLHISDEQQGPGAAAGNLAKTKEEEDDMEQRSEFLLRKQEVKEAQKAYMLRHPELGDIMADYLQLILHRKPEDVYAFTAEYFSL